MDDVTPRKQLPRSLTPDELRVIRDHAGRAKEELQRVVKKCPAAFSQWVYVEDTLVIQMADLLSATMDLFNFLDSTWRSRSPIQEEKTIKRNKHQERKAQRIKERANMQLPLLNTTEASSKDEFPLLISQGEDILIPLE